MFWSVNIHFSNSDWLIKKISEQSKNSHFVYRFWPLEKRHFYLKNDTGNYMPRFFTIILFSFMQYTYKSYTSSLNFSSIDFIERPMYINPLKFYFSYFSILIGLLFLKWFDNFMVYILSFAIVWFWFFIFQM